MRFRPLPSVLPALLFTATIVALLPAGGCFNPNGGVTGYFAYMSTPMAPKTVMIYDMRTNEPFFIQDIPVGKQLNFRFLQDGGDDPLYSPARLQWGITEAGDNASQLGNQLTCPPEESCRIHVELREAYPAEKPADERYGVDLEESQEHQTPRGGSIPHGSNNRIYD